MNSYVYVTITEFLTVLCLFPNQEISFIESLEGKNTRTSRDGKLRLYGFLPYHSKIGHQLHVLEFCLYQVSLRQSLQLDWGGIDHIDLRLMKRGLVNILYGQQIDVGKPISLVLAECETADEIHVAIAHFRKSNAAYSIRRDAVNGLGFQFLLDKKRDMGLAVLEFNAREHRRSPWVYESLAEAYMMSEDKKKAIENLEKLLELDPNNNQAKEKIEELGKKK